jgi:hypothetical protein
MLGKTNQQSLRNSKCSPCSRSSSQYLIRESRLVQAEIEQDQRHLPLRTLAIAPRWSGSCIQLRRCLSFVFFQRRNFHQGLFRIRPMDGFAVVSQCLLRKSFRVNALNDFSISG